MIYDAHCHLDLMDKKVETPIITKQDNEEKSIEIDKPKSSKSSLFGTKKNIFK